jgi:hypothetical protein
MLIGETRFGAVVTIEGFPNVVSTCCARVGLGVVAPDLLIVEEADVEGVTARNLFDALITYRSWRWSATWLTTQKSN